MGKRILLNKYKTETSLSWGTVQNSSVLSFLHSPSLTSIHDHWKTIALTKRTFVGKVMSLLFNMLSRLVITFLRRSKHLLISWLQSPSAVILKHTKIKSATVSTVSPSICNEVMEPDAMILVFCMLSFKPNFLLSSFTFIKRLFSSSLSGIRVMSSAYLRYWYFSQQSWFQLVLLPAQCFSLCTLYISLSRVTMYSLDVLLFLFGTSLLFHVQF